MIEADQESEKARMDSIKKNIFNQKLTLNLKTKEIQGPTSMEHATNNHFIKTTQGVKPILEAQATSEVEHHRPSNSLSVQFSKQE